LKKHLLTEGHSVSKRWLDSYDEYKSTKFSSLSKMDSKKFSLVKFFIDANMPMKALESVHLREMVDSRLAKFSFRERILPDIIQHLESVIATKLQSAHSIHIITDIWTSNTMADFEAAGAVLTYENLRRELIVIGMERM
jgi:hypothetical protein